MIALSFFKLKEVLGQMLQLLQLSLEKKKNKYCDRDDIYFPSFMILSKKP